MTTVRKPAGNYPDELINAVRGLGKILHRLVELGESALDLLARSSGTPNAQAGDGTAQAGPRSIHRSAHSKNVIQPTTIDLTREDIVSFVQASAMIPTHPSVSTVSRWCSLGCRGLRLESVLIGGRRKTTQQAINRFLIACSERNFAGMEGNISLLRNQVMAVKERLAKEQHKLGNERVSPRQTLSKKTRTARTRGASRNNDPSTRSKYPKRTAKRRRRRS